MDWTTGLTNFLIKHTELLSKVPQELIVHAQHHILFSSLSPTFDNLDKGVTILQKLVGQINLTWVI